MAADPTGAVVVEHHEFQLSLYRVSDGQLLFKSTEPLPLYGVSGGYLYANNMAEGRLTIFLPTGG